MVRRLGALASALALALTLLAAGPAPAQAWTPPWADLVPARTTQVVRTVSSDRWCTDPWCTITQAWQRDADGSWWLVREFRSHPAVYFWELEDEPVLNHIDFEASKRGYDLVKKIDPDHPVICTQWPDPELPPATWKQWATASDVAAFDWYPVPLKRWEIHQENGGFAL